MVKKTWALQGAQTGPAQKLTEIFFASWMYANNGEKTWARKCPTHRQPRLGWQRCSVEKNSKHPKGCERNENVLKLNVHQSHFKFKQNQKKRLKKAIQQQKKQSKREQK